MASGKPKLAVWKFASCDGCQLSLLDLEDELLMLPERIEIAYFLEASRAVVEGPYDLSLVEGSVTTPHDLEADRRQRPGRLRAPRLPDRSLSAARGDLGLPRRPPSLDPRVQRLRRVQAPRQRLRDGRARHRLPRSRHPRRLRGALPEP